MKEPDKKGLSWEAGKEAPGCMWSGKTLEGGLALPLSKGRVRGKEGRQSILCGSGTYSLVKS